jgi:hypothetical protein
LVALREVIQVHFGELGIRHGDDGPLRRADARRNQADFLDGAHLVAVIDIIHIRDRVIRQAPANATSEITTFPKVAFVQRRITW